MIPEAYKTRVQIVYILALFIQIIDGTIVNIAVPTLADEFDVDSTDVDWAIIGFYLALAVVIPAAGWLGDRYGIRRIFVIAIGGFTLASALCGAAQSLEQLIAFRILQGLFAGLITPIGSAMLYRAFPLAERAKASTAVIGVAVIAPALGPVLGGLIIETLSWRWIFYVNIPIGGAAFALALSWLREELVGTGERIDRAGLVLSAAGLAMVLFAISEGPNRGWGSPLIVSTLIGGTAALIALVIVETRVDDPVLLLRLWGNRLFRGTNLAAAPTYAGFFSVLFLLPIFLQKVADHSALVTGLTLAPQPVGVLIASQLGGRRLYGRYGPRALMIIASAAAFAVSVALVAVDESTPLFVFATLMFLRGLAVGTSFIPIQTAVYATVDNADLSRATSLFSMQRQVSIAVGVAVTATVLTALVVSVDSLADGGAPLADRVDAFQWAFFVSALFFVVAFVAAFFVSTEDARGTMRAQ